MVYARAGDFVWYVQQKENNPNIKKYDASASMLVLKLHG